MEHSAAVEAPNDTALVNPKWPGWPGYCVFRLIVPLVKVGSIIGRKGEFIKKLCEETRARIRVLEGVVGTSDRTVLISGKEDLDAPLSPAMDAVLRIFKRVTGLSDSEGEGDGAGVICSVRLLVATTHALSLIGKQGSVIKSIQESSGASVRVLSGEEVPFYVSSEERIVELQGESQKVEKALESVLGQLRKFLVDHGVLPLFEKNSNNTMPHSKPSMQTGLSSDFSLPGKRDSSIFDNDLESQIAASVLPSYAQDHGLLGLRSGLSRTGAPIVNQVTQTMQIPLSYAEDIIGIEGANIAYIRRTSGAILTVQESRALPDEITVEIKGTSAQVHTAQLLIQEFLSSHRESISSSYGKIESGFRSSYYPYSSPPLYGGAGYGRNFRL